jgi:hypothetical protein
MNSSSLINTDEQVAIWSCLLPQAEDFSKSFIEGINRLKIRFDCYASKSLCNPTLTACSEFIPWHWVNLQTIRHVLRSLIYINKAQLNELESLFANSATNSKAVSS